MTSMQIIICCHKKSKEQKYFVAPTTIIKQFEQDKINFTIEKDIISIMNKKFKIERGQKMLINAIFFITLIPFEFVTMKWLVKKLILEFKNMED